MCSSASLHSDDRMTTQLDTERTSRRWSFLTKFSSETPGAPCLEDSEQFILAGVSQSGQSETSSCCTAPPLKRVSQFAAVHRLARSSSSPFRPRFSGEVWRKSLDLPAAECLFSGPNDRGRPWLLSGNRTRRGPLNLKHVFLRGSGKTAEFTCE